MHHQNSWDNGHLKKKVYYHTLIIKLTNPPISYTIMAPLTRTKTGTVGTWRWKGEWNPSEKNMASNAGDPNKTINQYRKWIMVHVLIWEVIKLGLV